MVVALVTLSHMVRRNGETSRGSHYRPGNAVHAAWSSRCSGSARRSIVGRRGLSQSRHRKPERRDDDHATTRDTKHEDLHRFTGRLVFDIANPSEVKCLIRNS